MWVDLGWTRIRTANHNQFIPTICLDFHFISHFSRPVLGCDGEHLQPIIVVCLIRTPCYKLLLVHLDRGFNHVSYIYNGAWHTVFLYFLFYMIDFAPCWNEIVYVSNALPYTFVVFWYIAIMHIVIDAKGLGIEIIIRGDAVVHASHYIESWCVKAKKVERPVDIM